MRLVWAWLRRKRFSWLDLVAIAVAVSVIDAIQQVTAWPWWLADAVVLGSALAVVGVVAFVHGVWEALRG